MIWHDSDKTRKAIGDVAEKRFAKEYICSCGGHFVFIGDQYAGCPDFTCDTCGRLVDVKYSPQAEQTGNISVSAIPWDKYPDDLLLVTFVHEKLLGEYKKHIQLKEPNARQPTHRNQGVYKNTRFYLIAWNRFREYKKLGLLRM